MMNPQVNPQAENGADIAPILSWRGRRVEDLGRDELVAIITEQNAAMTRAVALNQQAADRIRQLNEALAGKPKIFTGH